MTNAQHTPGPLGVTDEGDISSPKGRIAICNTLMVADCPQEEWEGNARLLAAAYTSYDKHFGPNAIAAAEADLLGEALEAVREAWEMLPPIDPAHPNMGRYDRIRALLTKAGKAGQ
ncbi:hypothetical protein BSL82_15700 [Tardibacter chloracetimidivorans]|uniref:Uncharacterized protein n=1 Tax=Tardibacter chloracetimidivorans TaxID=1921510 RepID=A0A1L3ZY79_9SPHN|nr:hypothetical protein [Tardibacter chloracetimidivorans]API60549.1 hypothetical protein BSL82_15700 [Tardibacter chloracetimidivorans]